VTGDVYTTINVPNARWNEPFGINGRNQIVGSYSEAGIDTVHGFMLSSGVYTTIDVPGGSGTATWRINSGGRIAGSYSSNEQNRHGFIAIPTPKP
jgi:hypothetical protein